MATCEALMERLGFDCRLVGEQTLCVATPFTFVDGEPISFYVNEGQDSVSISDNADTLAHFQSRGYDISDRKKWKRFRQAVEGFDLELRDSGEIRGSASLTAQRHLVVSYMKALFAIAEIERDLEGLTQDEDNYVTEVEFYLRAWKPDAALTLRPSLVGNSGRTHLFDFQLAEDLVEAARPDGRTTGSVLRKSIDILSAGFNKRIYVIIDDREEREKAAVETAILSATVSVLPYTHLINQAGRLSVQ